MYQLERHGVQAVLVDRDGNDLWAMTPSGRMLAVQVKTASVPTRYTKHAAPSYRFHVGNLSPSTDIYALVALQAEVVVFCAPEEMRKSWPVELFTPDRMTASIRELLA